MDFRLCEPCIVKQSLQLLRRVGCHTLHHVRPFGVSIDHLYHDGEMTSGLQHSANLFGWAQLVKSDFNSPIFLMIKSP